MVLEIPGSRQDSEDGDFDRISNTSFNQAMEEPTSAILGVCKRCFINPYIHVLGVAGLRPRNIDSRDCLTALGHIQSAIVFCFLITSYVLQFLCGFRRDRGFTAMVPSTSVWIHVRHLQRISEITFTYVVPSILHLFGYIAALTVFRVVTNEQFQSLIERVFIVNNHYPRRLVTSCWMYKLIGLLWLLGSTCFVVLITDKQTATSEWFTKLSGTNQLTFTRLLIGTLFVQDFIQCIVLSSYAVQCFLLRHFLRRVKEKLLENTIDPLEWMREMTEFQKLLEHLNLQMSTPVSLFVILNFIYFLSGTYYIAGRGDFAENLEVNLLEVLNCLMWMLGILLPLHQAASLTTKCKEIQSCGHEIRIRPFLHHHTSTEDLNSVLIYASSLRMSAQLLKMPIKGGHLFGILILAAVILTTFGMCFPAP
uniref:Gustatory receptor n=2 Tax=Lutzomyia longipalpis TaxID=7200 RepID=A0A1B0CRZ0_LUTLO